MRSLATGPAVLTCGDRPICPSSVHLLSFAWPPPAYCLPICTAQILPAGSCPPPVLFAGPSFVPTGLVGAISLRAAPTVPTVQLEGLAIAQDHRSDGSVALHVTGWLASHETLRDPVAAQHALEKLELRLSLCSAIDGCICVTPCFEDCCRGAVSGDPASLSVGRGVLRVRPPYERNSADTSGGSGLGGHGAAAPSLLVTTPELWWPRGHGKAHLYELRATVCRGSACDEDGALTRRIGLRRVELVQQPALPPSSGMPNGTSFFFRVNGVDVYSKGSNLIPAHVFATAEADEQWHWLLQQAADANMNMVRVWGGGRYQRDSFYERCSELGLMVWQVIACMLRPALPCPTPPCLRTPSCTRGALWWGRGAHFAPLALCGARVLTALFSAHTSQEMIFACALYPRNAPFLATVKREVHEQVSRLAHHACIVVWGGNNENEAALGWYAESRHNRDLYLADYVKLYVDTVVPAVRAADVDRRPIVDTSPSNGIVSNEPYVKRWLPTSSKRSGSPAGSFGDIHYYVRPRAKPDAAAHARPVVAGRSAASRALLPARCLLYTFTRSHALPQNYEADCEDSSTYPLARYVSEHG